MSLFYKEAKHIDRMSAKDVKHILLRLFFSSFFFGERSETWMIRFLAQIMRKIIAKNFWDKVMGDSFILLIYGWIHSVWKIVTEIFHMKFLWKNSMRMFLLHRAAKYLWTIFWRFGQKLRCSCLFYVFSHVVAVDSYWSEQIRNNEGHIQFQLTFEFECQLKSLASNTKTSQVFTCHSTFHTLWHKLEKALSIWSMPSDFTCNHIIIIISTMIVMWNMCAA